ncbi:MAG: glycosyltransferase family 4 protein [Deltaproteobacteria bacterium]|nr:glycosyltransferase family 4 protein [Deltaproteobacteria bacterium]MBW2075087.1 glycosyltransferase family 4 protein [Deltaproteobacteria bacterium]RLB82251.1 MAG: hypothetical protein DRH17_06425 [Deltaproteobacteria bacterium]
MKVALIRKKYSPFGGAERYVDTLVRHLLDLGHEVHIFANEWESATRGTQSATQRLVFHRVPMIKGLSVLKLLSFAINVRRLLKKERFEIVHSFERTLYQDIARAGDGCHKEWLIQRAKYEPFWKRVLVGINPLHWSFLWIEKQIFDKKNTQIVIANSQRGKEEIIRHYGFPAERIRVIYNGVDTKRFNPACRGKFRKAVRDFLGLSEDIRVLLFLGSGFERKGLKFAIESLSKINEPKIKLVVAGKDNPKRYRMQARRLGVVDKVIFYGPTKEPERLYGAADVFVLPTIYEPFSNACLEAIASGVPVVTSKINGFSEFIEDGVTGVCVEDPSDIEALKGAIQRLLRQDNRETIKWAKTKGRLIDVENHVRETVKCYEAVLAGMLK